MYICIFTFVHKYNIYIVDLYTRFITTSTRLYKTILPRINQKEKNINLKLYDNIIQIDIYIMIRQTDIKLIRKLYSDSGF